MADKTEKGRLLNVIYNLSDLESNIKTSAQKTILLQAGIIKICMNQVSGDISALENKVVQLEQKLNNINTNSVARPAVQSARQSAPRPTQNTATSRPPMQATKQTEDWKEIVDSLKKTGKIRLYTCLVNTAVNKLNDQTWEIEFPHGLTDFNRKILEDTTNRNDLIKAIAMSIGHEINIKLKDTKNAKPEETSGPSGFEDLGIDINIID